MDLRCSICQALLDEEDLFCPNCGTEAPGAEARSALASRVSTHNFVCRQCGASMSYDASAGALRCPFCGSTNMTPHEDSQELAPAYVVPFAISRQQAEAAMRDYLRQGFWRPSDLSDQAMVVALTPVYVPYWVFEASTHTYWAADTDQTPPGASANWFPLFGEHHATHSGLLVGASGVLTSAETASLAPFDLSAGAPPEQIDLDNVVVEQFSVDRKYARPMALKGLEVVDARDCQAAYVPGRCRNMHVNVLARGLASQPALLPVWIMAYRYREEVFRFLVNGQTGRASGEAPQSFVKIALAVVAAVAIGIVALLAIGSLLGIR